MFWGRTVDWGLSQDWHLCFIAQAMRRPEGRGGADRCGLAARPCHLAAGAPGHAAPPRRASASSSEQLGKLPRKFENRQNQSMAVGVSTVLGGDTDRRAVRAASRWWKRTVGTRRWARGATSVTAHQASPALVHLPAHRLQTRLPGRTESQEGGRGQRKGDRDSATKLEAAPRQEHVCVSVCLSV